MGAHVNHRVRIGAGYSDINGTYVITYKCGKLHPDFARWKDMEVAPGVFFNKTDN